jgi:intracellular multiplication protein IcmO
MPALRQAKKVPLKYTPFSDHALILIKKYSYFFPLTCIPLAYFYPNLALLLVFCYFLFYFGIVFYAPEPLFEEEKRKLVKNKKVLPFIYVGNDEYGFPIEIPVTLLKQHVFLMGSTGSGKTSLLRRILHNQMVAGGGCCFIDGKADVADMYQIFYSVVTECDRLEDLLVLNFLNPEESHTFNPLLYGDATFISEILNSLLPPAQGDQVYWQQRGIELMRAIISVLVWLRDNRGFKLTFSNIRKFMNLHELVNLAKDESIPLRDENRPVRERLILYLQGLTSNWEKIGTSEVTDDIVEAERQFAYGVQQWSSTLDLLYGNYGKILDAEDPDVDMKDVVLNNKILYVLLPALKQSQQTLASLGRLIVSTFKIVFAELIGSQITGDAEKIHDMVESLKPDPPFLIIMDEAGSYIPEDVDNVLAQARSTGVGVIISVQEIASLKKGGEILEKRVLNNTKIKICLAVDDPEAAEYFVRRAGKEWTIVPSIRREFGELFDKVGNLDGSMSYDLRERMETIDLYKLKPGHGYIIYLDELRKFYSPYLKPKRPKQMHLLKFVKVVDDKFYEELQKVFRPFKVNGYVVNEWDENELEVLRRYDQKFQFSNLYKDLDEKGLAEEAFREFITLQISQMLSDRDFLKISEPTMEAWEEVKKIVFRL